MPLVAAWATLTALIAVFREQSDLVRSQVARDHVVVCGLGRRGLQLTKSFLERGRPVVAIESDRAGAGIEEARRGGARVVLGDASDTDVLRRAGIRRARCLVALCGADASNAAIVARLAALADQRRRPLDAFAHINRLELADDLTSAALAGEAPGLSVEWFNVHDRAAKAMLREHADLVTRASTASTPHLVIVGIDDLAMSLVVNSSRQWLALAGPDGGRLRVTVASPGSTEWLHALETRYPALSRVALLDAYEDDLRSGASGPEAERRLSDATAVFVAGDDDTASIELAFAAERIVGEDSPIVVRLLIESTGFVELLARSGAAGRIDVFGVINRTLSPEMLTDSLHETIARMFHDQYLATVGQTGPRYEDLDESFKESNRAHARHVSTKLTAVGCGLRPLNDWTTELTRFSPEEVEQLARLEHERWLEERAAAGWRYGPERDDDRRLNPYMVDYDELPDAVREYDRVFVRSLPSTLAAAGYQVYRLGAVEHEPTPRLQESPAS